MFFVIETLLLLAFQVDSKIKHSLVIESLFIKQASTSLFLEFMILICGGLGETENVNSLSTWMV